VLSYSFNQFILSIFEITTNIFDKISKSCLIKKEVKNIFCLFFKLTLLNNKEYFIDFNYNFDILFCNKLLKV